MAIAAINTQAADMMLMAELHRLFTRHAFFRGIAGTVECSYEPQESGQEKEGAKNAYSRDGIGTGMKYLRHQSVRIRCVDNLRQAMHPGVPLGSSGERRAIGNASLNGLTICVTRETISGDLGKRTVTWLGALRV
jgi:hypothetical protein